ncbi:MAG: hypothetical protein U0Z26_12790 [Anaerolineales bacterium]
MLISLSWVLWYLFKEEDETQQLKLSLPLLLVAGGWVFLSGVGGYAFQNWDHHWRNAVLRDLISYDWPVIYSNPNQGPIKMLVYYVGDWLPAALAGKLFGWKVANFVLFLWTWAGVLLASLHLSLTLKTSAFKALLFLIFFSGMDALGALLFAQNGYPTLWPPIQHLEIWSGNLQYSSFTTQLFWVFNQAVPAWLCVSLIWGLDKQEKTSQKILIWSLCFFFAPLASIGFFPYVFVQWLKQTDFKSPFKNIHIGLILVSILIIFVSYLFFSSNPAAQERGLQNIAIKDFATFFLFEGGLIWLLLSPFMWRDSCGTSLEFCFSLFLLYSLVADGFVMRASQFAPLFYLMGMTAEILFQNSPSRFYRIVFASILLIGAITPLYEINRSLYRTFEYDFVLDESQRITTPPGPATHLEQGVAPENEHPFTLTADDIQTLKYMNDKLSKNFIANVRQSLYYQYLSPR